MILWYVVWFTSSIARPLILATVVCMATNPTAAKAKLKLIVATFQYLLLCKDKKWKKSKEDPASFFKASDNVEKKTVIFLRHGESTTQIYF